GATPGSAVGSTTTSTETSTQTPGTATGSGGDLEASWERLLATGQGIPPGMSPFLRAARARSLGHGVLEVALPAGPGLERLQEPVIRRGLADAVTAVAGREVELRVSEGDASRDRSENRISPETVRQDRLRKLLEREPLLERAVEELDLELLD
ncbi:MAG: hypothetical protein ACLFWG_07670, partial [Longimicrobiales bacterium]